MTRFMYFRKGASVYHLVIVDQAGQSAKVHPLAPEKEDVVRRRCSGTEW